MDLCRPPLCRNWARSPRGTLVPTCASARADAGEGLPLVLQLRVSAASTASAARAGGGVDHGACAAVPQRWQSPPTRGSLDKTNRAIEYKNACFLAGLCTHRVEIVNAERQRYVLSRARALY